MSSYDDDLITRVAQLWIELGGDADGVVWTWRALRDKVTELQEVSDDVGAYICRANDDIPIDNSVFSLPKALFTLKGVLE